MYVDVLFMESWSDIIRFISFNGHRWLSDIGIIMVLRKNWRWVYKFKFITFWYYYKSQNNNKFWRKKYWIPIVKIFFDASTSLTIKYNKSKYFWSPFRIFTINSICFYFSFTLSCSKTISKQPRQFWSLIFTKIRNIYIYLYNVCWSYRFRSCYISNSFNK